MRELNDHIKKQSREIKSKIDTFILARTERCLAGVRQRQQIQEISDGNSTVSRETNIANYFGKYFETHFRINKPPNSLQTIDVKIGSFFSNVERSLEYDTIGFREIWYNVKLLKNKRSSGIDSISSVVIKGIKEKSILQFISRLFSIIMHLGHYPT